MHSMKVALFLKSGFAAAAAAELVVETVEAFRPLVTSDEPGRTGGVNNLRRYDVVGPAIGNSVSRRHCQLGDEPGPHSIRQIWS